MKTEIIQVTKKDLIFATSAGFLIGLLLLPVLKSSNQKLYDQLFFATVPFFLIATPLGLIIAHKISKKIAIFWQLGKFGISGVLNVLVDLGMLSLLTFFFKSTFQIEAKNVIVSGISILTFYSLYKAISFIIANINSYFWNKHWTFNKIGDKKSEFFQFFVVSVVGFMINNLVASFVFKYIPPVAGMDDNQWGLIGAAFGSIIGLAWNFIGYKFIVFKK
ncbi:MAG: GtrA family protein [Candidatus Moraniibacteriota bacterium]